MWGIGDPRKVFDEMCVRELISWTTLIVVCVRVGDMGEAGFYLDQRLDLIAYERKQSGGSNGDSERYKKDGWRSPQNRGYGC